MSKLTHFSFLLLVLACLINIPTAYSQDRNSELVDDIAAYLESNTISIQPFHNAELVRLLMALLDLSSEQTDLLHQFLIDQPKNQVHLIRFLEHINEFEYFADALSIVENLRLSAPNANSAEVDWTIKLMVSEAEILIHMGSPRNARELLESIEHELSHKDRTEIRIKANYFLGRAHSDMSLPVEAIEILEKTIDDCCTDGVSHAYM